MRKSFVKTLAMMMVAGTVLGSVGITAKAEEVATSEETIVKQALNKDVVAKVFDAKYYAATNSDVAQVTTDADKLLEHYMNFGIYEGRDASENFNASIYALANPDLLTAFGDSLEAMIEHYAYFGVNENRVSCVSEFATMDPATRSAAVSASTEVVKANEGTGKYDYVMPATQSSGKSFEESYTSALNGRNPEDILWYNSDGTAFTANDAALIQSYHDQNMWYNPQTKQAYAYGQTIYDDEVDEWGGRNGYAISPSGIVTEVYNISSEGFDQRARDMGCEVVVEADGLTHIYAPAPSSSSDSSSSSSDSGSSSSSSSDSGSSAGDFSADGFSWDD
ncbi:MAG: hypothetical protein K6B41_08090 [Butyrivibrio sp.]|nr:hypothetical protein [Butyrivibrio sp.]